MEKKEAFDNRTKKAYRLECSKLTAMFSLLRNEELNISHEKVLALIDVDLSKYSREELVKHSNLLIDDYLSVFSYVLPNFLKNQLHGYLSIKVKKTGIISDAEWRFFFVPQESIPYKIEFVDIEKGNIQKIHCTNGRIAILLWQWLYTAGIPDMAYSESLEYRPSDL